jgi:hypothetical protein
MKLAFQLIACLVSSLALIAIRDDANANQRMASPEVSTPFLYTDGSIIRLAQDEQSESQTQQAPDSSSGGDDSGQSNPPPENPD